MHHLMSNTHTHTHSVHASRNGFAMDIFRVTQLVHNLIWSEWNKHIRGNWTQLIQRVQIDFLVELGVESSMKTLHTWKPLSGILLYQAACTMENWKTSSWEKKWMNVLTLHWLSNELKEWQSLEFVSTVGSNDAAFILLLILAPALY